MTSVRYYSAGKRSASDEGWRMKRVAADERWSVVIGILCGAMLALGVHCFILYCLNNNSNTAPVIMASSHHKANTLHERNVLKQKLFANEERDDYVADELNVMPSNVHVILLVTAYDEQYMYQTFVRDNTIAVSSIQYRAG